MFVMQEEHQRWATVTHMDYITHNASQHTEDILLILEAGIRTGSSVSVCDQCSN